MYIYINFNSIKYNFTLPQLLSYPPYLLNFMLCLSFFQKHHTNPKKKKSKQTKKTNNTNK